MLLAALATFWGMHTSGIASSNDGSHVALARAQTLRGSTRIDPDVALTLGVDVAERRTEDGVHAYSDRPPGTAWIASVAIGVGARLDPVLAERARGRGQLVHPPASPPYILTYAKRFPDAPKLVELQGTAFAVNLHSLVVGALGLGLVFIRIRRRGIPILPGLVAVGMLGLGTLWGPYSTMLFNHVTAATLVAALLLALDRMELEISASRAPPAWLAPVVGALGAAAVASDYLLLVVVAPIALIRAAPRRWVGMAGGAVPVVIAVGAYHTLAFGAPWSIGYDHQAHFEFARTRASTFSGSFPDGLWTLLGPGRDAGLLVLSPVVLLAAIGMGPDEALPKLERRCWLAVAPWAAWVALLAFHRTPWGGEGSDHRYLIPLLPVVALGLARALTRREGRTIVWPLFALLGTISVGHVWLHTVAWRGTKLFEYPIQGLLAGILVGLGAAVVVVVGRRLAPDPRSW